MFPEPEYANVGEVDLALYRMGPEPSETEKPLVVFMHGFPELAYSWRHQMQAFADAGYSVVAPDMRGYGASEKPDGVENYTLEKLCGDMAGVLDYLHTEKAVFIGHDWGALVLWGMPFYQPDRVLACAGLNVAHTPHYPVDPIAMFKGAYGDDMYIVQFQEPEKLDQLFAENVDRLFRFFMRKPASGTKAVADIPFEQVNLDLVALMMGDEKGWGGAPLLNESEHARYVQAFSEGGFTGPMNWYRNFTHNWQDQKQFLVDGKLPKIKQPVLMITADMDRACPARLADMMPDLCEDFSRVDLTHCGHWSPTEKSTDINSAIMDWLKEKGL